MCFSCSIDIYVCYRKQNKKQQKLNDDVDTWLGCDGRVSGKGEQHKRQNKAQEPRVNSVHSDTVGFWFLLYGPAVHVTPVRLERNTHFHVQSKDESSV